MKTIFTEELKKFIISNLKKEVKLSDSLGGGLHYVIMLNRKREDEDYIQAKENFLDIISQFKEGDKIISEIKFIKNTRFISSSLDSNIKNIHYLDILILPKSTEHIFDDYQF